MKWKTSHLIIILSLVSSPAFAYIDPGMGSLWIQGAIAFGAGLMVTLKLYWQRLKLYGVQLKEKCRSSFSKKDIFEGKTKE